MRLVSLFPRRLVRRGGGHAHTYLPPADLDARCDVGASEICAVATRAR